MKTTLVDGRFFTILYYTIYPILIGLQDQNAKIWGNMTPTKIIFSDYKFT